MSDIIRTLRTIRPTDGQCVLNCSADDAELFWFTEVSRYDRKALELVVERISDNRCSIYVRPWSESDILASGGPSWETWVLFGAVILGLLIAIWQKFGFGSSLLIA